MRQEGRAGCEDRIRNAEILMCLCVCVSFLSEKRRNKDV